MGLGPLGPPALRPLIQLFRASLQLLAPQIPLPKIWVSPGKHGQEPPHSTTRGFTVLLPGNGHWIPRLAAAYPEQN